MTHVFNKVLDSTKKPKNIYFSYTLLFLLFIAVFFGWIFVSDYTFISDNDNLAEHYKAFIYCGQYLRGIIRNIFVRHQFFIPQFDINFGEGADIIQTLCLYGIGDPFSYISAFATKKYSSIVFAFSTLLRLYFSGIAFIYMCRYFHHKKQLSILAGAFCYCFVPYTTWQLTDQTCFLIPFYFFPLFIVGVNKILNNESPWLYVFTVFFAATSHFYFFYMLASLTVIYAVIKVFMIYGINIKAVVFSGVKCVLYAMLSLSMAGLLFFPITYTLLTDPRASMSHLQLLGGLKGYVKMPMSFIAYIVPLMVVVQFLIGRNVRDKASQKKKILLIILFVLSVCGFIFPFMSQIVNAFSYATNRWIFAFYLLCAYIVVCELDEIKSIKILSGGVILALNILYCVAITFIKDYGIIKISVCHAVIGIFLLIFASDFFYKKTTLPKKFKSILCFICIVASVFTYNKFDLVKNSTIKTDRVAATLFDNDATKAKAAAAKDGVSDFYRYAQLGEIFAQEMNVGPISGVSSTQYYWSLSNAKVVEFRRQLEVLDQLHDFMYWGYDTRPILTNLANVLYFCKQKEQTIPPLYHFASTEQKTVFKNMDFMPFGYTYENYILKPEFEKKNAVEKELLLTKAAVVEKPTKNIPQLSNLNTEATYADFVPEYQNGEIEFSHGKIKALKDEASILFKVNSPSDKNVLLRFEELNFTRKGRIPAWVTLEITTNTGYKKIYDVELGGYLYFNGLRSYTFNLGYFTEEQPLTDISIKFSDEGDYVFKNIQLICEPMDVVVNNLKKLEENRLQNIKYERNSISGNITLDSPKLLCLSIPYLDGWKAKVDGKDQELLCANIQYMALELPEGNHIIELRYETPMLKLGAITTVFGLAIFVALIFYRKRKMQIRNQEENRHDSV